jgi:hypothetical membrane protein
MVVAATIISPWFRWDINAVSELGVGEVSLLFNSAMWLGGVLGFVFALGLRRYLVGNRHGDVGTFLIMVSSVCLFLVGVFTISFLAAHAIVALGYFLLAPIGSLLIGIGDGGKVTRRLSLATGIAALVSILVLPMIIFFLPFKVGFAVPEMIHGIIIAVWTIFMGIKLLRR